MTKISKFNNAKHEIFLGFQKKCLELRYTENSEHVKRYYFHKASEVNQTLNINPNSYSSYDPIMSDF